jgi:3-deoxy-7-phosphoheptulonate synthase
LARTTESQIHREMVSGLELPVGFKNGTDGGIAIACDAMRSAAHPHRHFGMDAQGYPAIIESLGNPDTHLVLRGGHKGPNYDAHSVAQARQAWPRRAWRHASWSIAAMPTAARTRCASPRCSKMLQQRLAGDRSLVGVMIEGHLFDGCQALGAGALKYGVSITDGCLGWSATETMLREAAKRL